MHKDIENILNTWHKHYEDKELQYSEFEDSDIEYFVGCMLYNTFSFSKALDTLKTIDPSYDFLTTCGEYYEPFLETMKNLEFENEMQKVKFLQDYIKEAKSKYNEDELYLLNRLQTHVDSLAYRYEHNLEPQKVVFKMPSSSANRNPFGNF